MVTASTQEEIESNLTAHYEIEEFTYFPSLHVNVKSATSTRGSNLTGQNRDRTGIMIWPATHLLCQEIVSGNVGSTAKTILELGCGCGLVGVVASLALNSQYEKKIWVSSDMDEKALELCIHNFELNGIDATTDDGPRVRKLTWGESKEMHAIQDELFNQTQTSKFDVVVGADIVYPATTGQVLVALFDTVNFFLKDGGVFYLSFATREKSFWQLVILMVPNNILPERTTLVFPKISKKLYKFGEKKPFWGTSFGESETFVPM